MFFFETVVLVLAVTCFGLHGLWKLYRANQIEERQARALPPLLDPLLGQKIDAAISRFGQPAEFVPGTTGRGLYTWHSPPSREFPPGNGVLVVTLTVDASGEIAKASWTNRAG
jgi:hypothetical protein